MCWFTPDDEVKQSIKFHCEELVGIVKRLDKIGDPLGCEIKDIHELIDHLYSGKCPEKPKE
jgi:hypothetical protein